MTRQMAIFSELENRLSTAQRDRDAATIEKLLGDEFQVWNASGNGDPIPREDWERREAKCAAENTKLGLFATRVVGNANLVNFRMTRTCKGSTKPESYYLVDVWEKDGDSWKLVDRTESAVPAASLATRATGKR